MSSSQPPSSGPPSAQPSYAGWEYQILASVWLALKFILLKGSDEIIVEPASNEDIEAKYQIQQEATTFVRTTALAFKLCNGVVWSRVMFEALFPERAGGGSRGPKPRSRPLSHLQADDSLRFVLITNTLADRELRDFVIKQVGHDSNTSSFSNIVAEPQVVRRVEILEGKHEDFLLLKIERLLQNVCHVPHQRLGTCIEALKQGVRARPWATAVPP